MEPLTLPVGLIARGFEPVHAEDSIERAAQILREMGGGILPITLDGKYMGVISETTLSQFLAAGGDPLAPAASAVEPAPTIGTAATGAEALRRLHDGGLQTLVAVNPDNEPVGLISASDLFPRKVPRPTPSMVGGMATPFGVYLTTGAVHGGASPWALMATGALLSALLLTGIGITTRLLIAFPENSFLLSTELYLPYVFFMIAMRSLPLAGTHAAEHMVVHAIERGEALVPEVVKRMPRVHPRCGTNLAVGVTMFIFLSSVDIKMEHSVQTMFAALLSLMLFRTVGGWVQWLITTRPPNARQVAGAVRAADDLLNQYAKTRRNHANFFVRLLNMGLLHVMAGGLGTVVIAHFIVAFFHWDLGF